MIDQYLITKPVYGLLIALTFFAPFALKAQEAPSLEDHIGLLKNYISANDTCFGRLATNGLEALNAVETYDVLDFEPRISAYDNAARFFRAARVCLQNDRIQSLLANRLLEDILALKAREEREMELLGSLDIIALLGNTPTVGTKKIVYENVLTILQQLKDRKVGSPDDSFTEENPGPNKETLDQLIKYTFSILQELPSIDIDSLHPKLADTTGFNSPLTAEVVQTVETAASIRLYPDHRASVIDLSFAETGNYLMSRARDSTVSLRRIDEPGQTAIRLKHGAFVHDAAWYDDGQAVITVGSDGKALRWELESQTEETLFRDSTGALLTIATNSEGQILLGSRSGMVHFISSADTITVNHGWPVYQVAFSPDGKGFLSHSPQGFKVWDKEGNKIHGEEWSGKLVYHTHFTQNIDRVVISDTDSLVQVRNYDQAANTQPVPIWSSRRPVPTLQLIQPKLLLAANGQDSVKVWDLNGLVPDELVQLGVPYKIGSVGAAMLPGNYLLVLTADEKGQLYFNSADGQVFTLQLSLNQGEINTISIHPSGRFFAAGLHDGQILTGEIRGITGDQ